MSQYKPGDLVAVRGWVTHIFDRLGTVGICTEGKANFAAGPSELAPWIKKPEAGTAARIRVEFTEHPNNDGIDHDLWEWRISMVPRGKDILERIDESDGYAPWGDACGDALEALEDALRE